MISGLCLPGCWRVSYYSLENEIVMVQKTCEPGTEGNPQLPLAEGVRKKEYQSLNSEENCCQMTNEDTMRPKGHLECSRSSWVFQRSSHTSLIASRCLTCPVLIKGSAVWAREAKVLGIWCRHNTLTLKCSKAEMDIVSECLISLSQLTLLLHSSQRIALEIFK